MLPSELLALAFSHPNYLAEILKYHVVSGDLYTSNFTNGEMLPTLEMESLTISKVNETDIMVDDAMIIHANITASNGVIQVIDRVLIPPSLMSLISNSNTTSTSSPAAAGNGTQPPSSGLDIP